MRSPRLRKMVLAALLAALISVVAPFRFFLPGVPNVPVTLQVVVVLLAGGLLGPAWGAISMLIYLFLGAVGLPVFAGGNAGLQVLVGLTGGYLWSYPVAAFIAGLIAPAQKAPGIWRTGLAMLVGLLIIYVGGGGWAVLIGGKTLGVVMSGWVLPFVPLDLVKVAVAAAGATAVNRALARLGYWQGELA